MYLFHFQLFGDAAIANNLSGSAGAVNVPLGYATALALAVYVAGGVSGELSHISV